MLWRFGALVLGGSFRLWRFYFPTLQIFKASKPERLDALALWRFGAWRLFDALALLGASATPQSLKAAKSLWRFTHESLKAAKPLWRLTSQSLKASKLERLGVWRFGAWRLFGALALLRAFPTLQSLKASKPERLDALALWRFGALRLFDALALLGVFPTPQSLKG